MIDHVDRITRLRHFVVSNRRTFCGLDLSDIRPSEGDAVIELSDCPACKPELDRRLLDQSKSVFRRTSTTRQARVAEWVHSTFGETTAKNGPERVLRAAEEIVELAQACGLTAETLHRLVDYVFDRPVGKVEQEIAGSMVTLYAAASALDVDADAAFETELERIQRPEVVERCRRRQLEKREALVAADREEGT